MEITPFRKEWIPQAAALFVRHFSRLRERVPVLPDTMAGADHVAGKLDSLFDQCPGVAALAGGRLAGYMGWYLIDQFRGADRKAAYCPEWGHAATEGSATPIYRAAIYRALYRAASAQWLAEGCQTHALTLLAHDPEVERAWFWNGFGLTVVDAVRSLDPLGAPSPAGLTIRKASPADADALASIEAEHWGHYAQPPVLMMSNEADDAAGFVRLLANPDNAVWIAVDGAGALASYMRFEGRSFGAADAVNADTTAAATGAYTRPAYRGRGIAAALLDAALRDYADRGFARCSVDFESFNPEAAVFWMKYFEPVCLSVLRVPERA